jgi:5-amino-6-(5-phospho-D-ribitylamino)uracil phosphatase
MSSLVRALLFTIVLALVTTAALAAPMLRVKAIYVDLDGTALDTSNHVRPATVEALHEFQKKGGHVGIATGRTREQADEAFRAIEPDLPLILYNGAEVSPRGSAPRVLGHLDSTSVGIATRVLGNETAVLGLIAYYPDKAVAIRDSPELEAYAKKQSLTLSPAGGKDGDPLKLLALCPQDAMASVQPKLRAEIGNRAQVVNSSENALALVPAGIDKLKGIREALRGTSISLQDVLAFGDGENDVQMLSGVGFGAAMNNCVPPTCACADVIIGSNSSDAIARFVRTFVLGLPSEPPKP